ncbi:MAG: MBOAT family O-acyltransferase [Eubacteriales bacterium]|nr:MBOAT family O-acyltransferase [Eubacteriales bacterium]
MLFSSISFLYYFLPIVLILYFAVPMRMKNGVLLLSSLFFYAWGEPKYVLIMLVAIIQGYGFGRLIEKSKQQKIARAWLWTSITISLGLLCYCKYVDFFIENINAVTGLSLPLLKIALPIGISFYSFQIIGYTVDVYRKTVPAQKNFIDFAAYVTMFSQLIAGPIVRYRDIEEQLATRTHSVHGVAKGIRRFVLGLSKKVLIANVLGELVAIYKDCDEKTILFAWVYAIAYTLHVYFDFSGYSDMAIGLGEVFGFHFPENFNYPYIANSITDFWRRWHISLGSWFRDYLYIPLGGNRVVKWKWFRNLFIVWMATGLWHGAAWNFVLWGLMFAVLLMVEKGGLLTILQKIKPFEHVYVLFFVIVSFVLFDSVDLKTAGESFSYMFGMATRRVSNITTMYYLKSYAFLLVIAMVGATPLPKRILERVCKYKAGEKVVSYIEPVWIVLLLAVATAFLVDGSYNPFLYFRF